MKLKIHYIFIAWALLLFTACEDDESEIERTVLIYIMGDNSLGRLVDPDYHEILEGALQVDLTRNNLLVYMDNGASVKLVHIKRSIGGTVVPRLVKAYENNRNSVDPDAMKEVFSLVYDQYPAKSYGLALWSHGEGWKPGTTSVSSRWVGQDLSGGDHRLSIATLDEILGIFPHYDYILFDACFMQSIEVAYELRRHTDYFISSPAEIPGPGAPYQAVVPAMFATTNPEEAIARSYYSFYEEQYTGNTPITNENWTGGVFVSVVAADKLEALAAATKAILPTFVQHGQPIDVNEVLNYDRRRETRADFVGYYDLKKLMESLATNPGQLAAWSTAFDAAVPYAQSTPLIYTAYNQGEMFSVTGYSGVSSYVPRSNVPRLNDEYSEFEWYTAAGWNETGW